MIYEIVGQHSVVSIQEALRQARKKGLDLVEVKKCINLGAFPIGI